MKRPVIWSQTARAKYLEALRYIARHNLDAAERVARRVEEAAASVAEFATGRPGRVQGTYEKVVTGLPYILAYELISYPHGGESIAILHLIHGARDWPQGAWPQE